MKTIQINHFTFVLLGLLLFLFGLTIRLNLGKLGYERSKAKHPQYYKNYRHYLMETYPESLLIFAGGAFMCLGVYIAVYGF